MKRLILRVVTTLLATVVAYPVMFGIGKGAEAAPRRACIVAAVGDIGKTPMSGKPTANLIREANPPVTAILGLGDLAYPDGSDKEFKEHFLVHFQDFVDNEVFWGTPGNHEHHTDNAQGFRNALRNVGRFSHYGISKCGWRILSIDTEKPHINNAGYFIAAQRRDPRFRHMPFAIFTHKPCMSNGDSHGNETGPIEPVCTAARKAGVKLILSGHDHSYERFAPMGGLRQFVAGTGGAGISGFGNHAPGSQAQIESHGVLFFTLYPHGAYTWQFRNLSDRVLDQGVQR